MTELFSYSRFHLPNSRVCLTHISTFSENKKEKHILKHIGIFQVENDKFGSCFIFPVGWGDQCDSWVLFSLLFPLILQLVVINMILGYRAGKFFSHAVKFAPEKFWTLFCVVENSMILFITVWGLHSFSSHLYLVCLLRFCAYVLNKTPKFVFGFIIVLYAHIKIIYAHNDTKKCLMLI